MLSVISQTPTIVTKPEIKAPTQNPTQTKAQSGQNVGFDIPPPLQNMKEQVVKGEFVADTATMARFQEVMANIEWMDSAEGKAWRQEQLAIQNARPVELAIYQGDKIVGFKSEGSGFTSSNGLAGLLPDGWDKMSPEDLKQALNEELTSRGSGQYIIRTLNDGLSMTTGQATDIFNQR